jgi:hypothetical protein
MLAPVATMGGARRCGAQGPAYAGSQGAADTARPRRRRHRITHVRLLHLLTTGIGLNATSADVRFHVGYWGVSGTVTSGANPSLLTLRRHLPVVRRRFALSTFTLPSEGSYHLLAGVDRADLLRGSNGELIALQFEEPDLGRASQNLVPR